MVEDPGPPRVFVKCPFSSQNPLLDTDSFHRFCEPRFPELRAPWTLREWLQAEENAGTIRPAFATSTHRFYSTFQAWQIHHILRRSMPRETRAQFETLLRLLVSIQDFYLPEVRSDRRDGTVRDYHGEAVIAGTHFVTTSHVLLSAITSWREGLIANGSYNPTDVLSGLGLTCAAVEEWLTRVCVYCSSRDPLWSWRRFLALVSYERRQQLRYEALLFTDFYEMAELLLLFLGDLKVPGMPAEVQDWNHHRPTPGSDPHPEWRRRRYGEALESPYELLEYLANDFEVNPRPKAIVLTEGEEYRALQLLYDAAGYPPKLLGIEFRPIGGSGDFQLKKWQRFVEYMHEKQVLVYFVVDKEGTVAREARRFLQAKRSFSFLGLTKVIPFKDRIKVWGRCFEESNFTDSELAAALRGQSLEIDAAHIAAARRAGGKGGLITRIASPRGWKVKKSDLAVALAQNLIALRRLRGRPKRERAVERFVRSSAELILRNHRPSGKDSKQRSFATGLLG